MLSTSDHTSLSTTCYLSPSKRPLRAQYRRSIFIQPQGEIKEGYHPIIQNTMHTVGLPKRIELPN